MFDPTPCLTLNNSSSMGSVHLTPSVGVKGYVLCVRLLNRSHFATSVQKGCKWENSNLRKTIFIVQAHKGNNPNIVLQTGYNLWAGLCHTYVQLQPLSTEPYSLTTFLSLAYQNIHTCNIFLWCSNCSIIHGHVQPFPRNFSEVLTIRKCT